jgi:hypothetical protein
MPSVGQELLDVPLPDMVAKLAFGIADAQAALDKNSIETAKALADIDNGIEIVPVITQTIAADGKVSFSSPDPVKMTLIQIGLLPTFYQFAEATIEVSMDIKTTSSRETSVKVESEFGVKFKVFSASIKAEVSHNRKFGKEVHGTSRMITRLVPVPPPPLLQPRFEIVDNRT